MLRRNSYSKVEMKLKFTASQELCYRRESLGRTKHEIETTHVKSISPFVLKTLSSKSSSKEKKNLRVILFLLDRRELEKAKDDIHFRIQNRVKEENSIQHLETVIIRRILQTEREQKLYSISFQTLQYFVSWSTVQFSEINFE